VVTAAYYRHEFKQGEDYTVDIELRDDRGDLFDTTDWTGDSEIRTLDGALAGNFTVSFPGGGVARFALANTVTVTLAAKRYLSDARFTDAGGKAAYYLDGDVVVRARVTV
jgi:hypothetical protein